jgi:threonine/homoserine/homoserine lactone efflux protein
MRKGVGDIELILEVEKMLQLTVESSFLYFAAAFIFFGVLAIGWLAVHVEHARHFSRFKVIFALILGALFLGFGIHFLLLATGS